MKRYVRANSITNNGVLRQAIGFAEGFKGSTIDLDNHIITIPFSPDITEPELMQDGMLGAWFRDNGFNVSFERRDVEYQTKGSFNPRSMIKYSGHKAYLRNRLVMTATW